MKKILIGLFFLGVISAFLLWKYYHDIFENNIREDVKKYELFINPGQNLDEIIYILEEDSVIQNINTFKWVSGLMNYGSNKIPTGRYLISSPTSNKNLITKLRAGWQDPINITINAVRNIPELSGKLAKNLLIDSITILNDFNNLISENDTISSETFISYFIPNTYQVYWNISSENLWQRMMLEYKKYWHSNDRNLKLKHLGLSATDVYTLASIVEKETNRKSEKPIIAGVYINRLNQNIKLQADPTVVFATKNFKLRRILNKHLAIESPYNTYKNTGLPPGPICMPSLTTIEAVLNANEHDYIFFCAEPGYQGKHAFASTLREHNNNAIRYRSWLKKEGIR